MKLFTPFLLLLMALSACREPVDPVFRAIFRGEGSEQKWAVQALNPELPSDWSSSAYLTFDMKTSTAQRWFLKIYDATGVRQLRMQPFQGTWIRVSIPLELVRKPNTEGLDVATLKKRALPTLCIGLGQTGPVSRIDSLGVEMIRPIGGQQTLEIRSVRLTTTAEDAILEPGPLVDEYGQWIPFDRTEISTFEEMKTQWAEEEQSLQPGRFSYGKYGGYLDTRANSTGYFRVERINGRWWFVDPDGHLFFSTGVTCMNAWNDTRYEGREEVFTTRPPGFTDSPKRGPYEALKYLGRPGDKSFYSWNLYRRFGPDWQKKWIDLSIRRMEDWGLNTIGKWSDPELMNAGKKAYVVFLRGWGIEEGIMGLPDIYAEGYAEKVDSAALIQCTPRREDPWLLGYYIGQEPGWAHNELILTEALLTGPPSPIQNELKEFLSAGDTPERRRSFVYKTYSDFLDIINEAIRKHDPNHLILGVGFAGKTPPEVIRASRRCFDVFSFTNFDYVADLNEIQKIHDLIGVPVIIGEFHFGTTGRGLAPGLVQAASLKERGTAYRYYVENSAVHPAVIGIHWFQWTDQMATGRHDGENYNTGLIDITDRPYKHLIEAIKMTNERLFGLHAGAIQPVSQRAMVQ